MGNLFTEEQVEFANNKSIESVAAALGLSIIPFSRNTLTTKEHDSLKISPDANSFIWYSRGNEGGPIQLVMAYNNCKWTDAVKFILGNDFNEYTKTKSAYKSRANESFFKLPDKSKTFKHMYAYMINTRGIRSDVVEEFVKNKSLYESVYKPENSSKEYFNATFVGFDENGNSAYATSRSTNQFLSFKGEVEGSNKEYAFHREGNDDVLFIFESPIELMSFLSILKNQNNLTFNSHMLAQGGLSTMALHKYLSTHTNIESVVVCTNNDEAGHRGYLKILEELLGKKDVERLMPNAFDWNNDLTNSQGLSATAKEFNLPVLKTNYSNSNLRYLESLGISKSVVDYFIENKMLYQTIYGNISFVGLNEDNEAVSSFVKSINILGERFEGYTESSDTSYAFSKSGTTNKLCIFKDPTEMLAYLTLLEIHRVDCNHHFIAYCNDTSAIKTYLKSHESIDKIVFCTSDQKENSSIVSKLQLTNYELKSHAPSSETFLNDLMSLKSIENDRADEVMDGP